MPHRCLDIGCDNQTTRALKEGEEKLFTFVIYTLKTSTKLLMCCSADHDMLHQQMTYGMMYPCCKENNNLANDPIIDSKNELSRLKRIKQT